MTLFFSLTLLLRKSPTSGSKHDKDYLELWESYFVHGEFTVLTGVGPRNLTYSSFTYPKFVVRHEVKVGVRRSEYRSYPSRNSTLESLNTTPPDSPVRRTPYLCVTRGLCTLKCKCMFVHVHTRVCVCTHVCVCTCARVCVCVCTGRVRTRPFFLEFSGKTVFSRNGFDEGKRCVFGHIFTENVPEPPLSTLPRRRHYGLF